MNRHEMKKIVTLGITGGPATGKSLVARGFSRLGAALIDADVIAREVVEPGTRVFKAVVRAFGQSVLRPDGTLDRKALGRIVFADYERLAELTALTHPEILRIIRARIAALKEEDSVPLIVVDAPLLFESGLDADMDKVAVVFVEEDEQVRRLMARNGVDRKSALRLIESQMPLEEKKARADFIIDNNGTPEETLKQVEEIYKSLLTFF